MKKEALVLLLAKGEGLRAEFKERFSNRLDRDMVAFANTKGGQIILGVDDQGVVIGQRLSNALKAKINDLARNCDPAVALLGIEQIGEVVLITIEESNEKPHGCSTGYFRRLDAATQKMNQQELSRLFDASSKRQAFELQINPAITWDDVSSAKIQRFLFEAKIKLGEINVKKLLNSLHLAHGDGINHAGVLFFAKDPRRFLFQCEMTLVAFKGVGGVHIYDRVDVSGDLITQFDEAMIFIKKHLNVRSEIIGVQRFDVYEIPLEALREAIVNAIVHRDYAVRGTSLMVEVHEDRVEIKNPGGLPPGLSVDALTQVSYRRNEVIADIFSRTDRAERVGSGIRRIMDLLNTAGLAMPVIHSDAFFRITFKRDPRFKVGVCSEEKAHLIPKVDARSANILLHVGKNSRITAHQLAQIEGISQRAIEKRLAFLKAEGYLMRIGSTKAGYWHVV